MLFHDHFIMTTVNTTKEQERAELHRAIWQIANDLRGSVDGWDFKQYVLGMLFYRFISENLTIYINEDERRSGKKDFDYTKLSDKEADFGRADTVKEKGFYILPSELFVNVRKNARNDANLNETLAAVFRNIENSAKGASSEDDLKGLFDDLDVNSNKLGGTVEQRNKKLVKLMEAIGDLRLGDYADNTIDAFGDAYEFLMTMYASTAGKSGGEFFTPQEVSELLAEITTVGKKEVNKVYDPACGSGSLLLKFAKVLGKENVRQGFFGQEISLTIYNLCRINMFLHDINYNNFDIANGDTLTDPKHWDDEPFDAIVSNPPYSIKWEGDSNPLLINDPRFSPAGVLAPKSKADLAFTMESVVANQLFVSLMKVYTYLANDVRFVSASDIQRRQLAVFTEAWFKGSTDNIDFSDDSVFESPPHRWYWKQENMPFSYVTYEGEADETRAIRDLYDADLTNIYNKWRKKTADQVYKDECNGFLIWLLKCVRQMKGIELSEGITRDEIAESMNIMITLFQVLQRIGALEGSQEKISKMLQAKELSEKIPFIKYSAVMNMCLAKRAKNKSKPIEPGEWRGEVTDIGRIANYATYCDAVFTDKFFAEQLEKDNKVKKLIGGKCKFFHLKKYEFFMEYLAQLEEEYAEQITISERILGSIEPSFDLIGLSK